jgi:predicted Fe-Mo cluster-binding NifX family protein
MSGKNPAAPENPNAARRANNRNCIEFRQNNRINSKEYMDIMRIAITSREKELTSEMDPRFGRAEFFIIVETDSMAHEVVPNTQNLTLAQGAGIQAGKTLIENNVDVLITGNCGPKAFKVLEAAGIKIIVGETGLVCDAVTRFNEGDLKVAQSANVDGHWV